jgi:hypothetical protein
VRIPLVLIVGLLLTAFAVALAVSRSPLVLLSASPTQVEGGLTGVQSGTTVCQAGETLPAGTSAIRFSLSSAYGPSMSVEARADGQLLTRGSRGGEWVGPTAIAVTPVAHTSTNVTVCLKVGTVTEGTALSGGKASRGHTATINGNPSTGGMRIEYLRPGPKSFASLASSIATHMGMGNASGGSWIVFLLIVLMATIVALASWGLIGDLR